MEIYQDIGGSDPDARALVRVESWFERACAASTEPPGVCTMTRSTATPMRIRAVLLVAAVILLFAVPGCGENDLVTASDGGSSTTPGHASFGGDVPVDLAVYFRDDVSDGEITDFIWEVLLKPAVPGRRGQDHLDGVQYTSGDYLRGAVYVTFFPNATEAQRRAVTDTVLASPLVERIAKDVTPSETPID